MRRSIDAECVGYRLAPLLNAAGRVGSARDAYELLMASDDAHAERLATALLEQNARRRAQTERLIDHVERTAGVLDPDAPLVFTSSDDYAVGVIGPAAARIAERFGRPAVVATWCGDEARGSCRSVPGFHITEALDRCTDLLTRHGGHAAAAGFCMPRDALPALRDRLTHIAAASRPRGGWSRVLTIDAEAAPGDLGPALYRELAALEPHGADNPRPLLLARRMSVVGVQTFGHAGAHLRLRLRECGGAVWTALAWRSGARVAELLSEKQSAAARVAELLSEKQSAAARVAELLSDPPLAIDVLFHLAGEERDGELRLWLDVQDFRAAQ